MKLLPAGKKIFRSNLEQSIQASSCLIGTGVGPFFGRNTTDYLTGKIQTPQNISSGLFSKFSTATVLPWGAC